jgi:hypothetical protein
MKLYIVPDTGVHITQNVSEYYEMDYNNFIDIIFGSITNNISIVDDKEQSDLLVCGIQTLPETILDKKTMLVCVENCSAKGRTHYKHFNLYGHYNDKRISIHIYNDITKLIVNDDYIAIPFIYLYVDQFIRLQNTLSIPKVPFSEKKFCLFTSRNSLNDNKMRAIQELVKYGDVDSISNYPEITNKSCYHSKELLNVYSQYKFVMCFENSHNDGYITEKIFNVFLAGSIPIYDGPSDISKYINTAATLLFEDSNVFKKIKLINSNKIVYENVLNKPKISNNYDNENWSQHLLKFLG